MTSSLSARSERHLRLLGLGLLLGGWQLAAVWLQTPLLPSPIQVLHELQHQFLTEDLLYHLGVTLWRVLAAFALAMVLGSLLGIAMGSSVRLDALLDSLLVLGLNLPALVTILLCYLWLGLNDLAAITAVALNKIPTVAVTLREGARNVDRGLLEVAWVHKVPFPRWFLRVYLPQLYPYLMAAARSGLALIWKIVLVVELLGRSNGIGFKLGSYFQFFDIQGVLACTLAFAAVVLAVEALLMRPIDRRLAVWR